MQPNSSTAVREIAPSVYVVDLPKRERPRTRKLSNGFRVDCAHVLKTRYGSALSDALFDAESDHCVWRGTWRDSFGEWVAFKVNSMGLRRVRALLAAAPHPLLMAAE